MAIVNFSLDTITRQAVLTVDGSIVQSSEVYLSKYAIDGEEVVGFSYMVEVANADGMKETRMFFLPTPEELATEAHASVSVDGLASKIVHDDEQVKADVIDFLERYRNNK